VTERGFFAIGIERCKTGQNLGSLWRSAYLNNASFIFTVGRRYSLKKDVGIADTVKAWRSIPLMHFDTVDHLIEGLPYSTPLIGIELDDRAKMLSEFTHPERGCYVLGSEDHGLSKEMISRCHSLVKLPGTMSMNVACAGAIVMYDRFTKREQK